MSSKISRRNLLKGLAAGAVSLATVGVLDTYKTTQLQGSGPDGVSTIAPVSASALYKAGTYTSIQSSSYASVEVTCTFSENALTDVKYQVLRTSVSDYFTPFVSAMEQYCQRIVENGKTDGVDGVIGATRIQIRVGANGQEMNIWAPDVQHIVPGADGLTGYGTMFDYSSHYGGLMDGSRSGFTAFLPMVKAIKEAVSIPVGCAGYMDLRVGPDYINDAIKRGDIDLIFMNRPLNCDPELVRKIQEHKREDIRPSLPALCNHIVSITGVWNRSHRTKKGADNEPKTTPRET